MAASNEITIAEKITADKFATAKDDITIDNVAHLELQELFDYWEDPKNYSKIAGAIAIETKIKEDRKTPEGKETLSSLARVLPPVIKGL